MKLKPLHFILRLLALALNLLVADLVLIAGLKAFGRGLNYFDAINPYFASLLVLALWFLVIGPVLLATWGTTPGFWLLKIKITNQDGGKLNLWQALGHRAKVTYEKPGALRVIIALIIVLAVYGSGLLAGFAEEGGGNERIYLKYGQIYAFKDDPYKEYDIVVNVIHVSKKQLERIAFFETIVEADAAGYKPSEDFEKDCLRVKFLYECFKPSQGQ